MEGPVGAACEPFSPTVRQMGPVGRGVAWPRSVPLLFLGRQQSGCLWRRSGHGGQGLHTAPVRGRLLSPGAVSPCGALGCWRGFACPSRFLREQAAGGVEAGRAAAPLPDAAVLQGGGGTVASVLGGAGGRRPRGPRIGGGEQGDRGGGSRRRSLPPSSGGGGLWPPAQSPLRRQRIPPRCARSAGVVDQPGRGGLACEPPCPDEWPGGLAGQVVALPRSAPLPSLGGQQSRRHWRRSGPWGAWPPYCSGLLSCAGPGMVRVSSLCAGAVSSACRGPCGSRQWGAWQRAACGLSCVPPGRHSPFRGRGDVPRPWGGWRVQFAWAKDFGGPFAAGLSIRLRGSLTCCLLSLGAGFAAAPFCFSPNLSKKS